MGSGRQRPDERGNRYEAAKEKGDYDEEAQKREHAKHALERYMHYYQRWAENDKARLAAAANMARTQAETLETLSNLYATPTSQLKFVTDAWGQVRALPPTKCRRRQAECTGERPACPRRCWAAAAF